MLLLGVCHTNLAFSGHISCIMYVLHSFLPLLLSPFLVYVCSGELTAQSIPGSATWHIGQRKVEWGVASPQTSQTSHVNCAQESPRNHGLGRLRDRSSAYRNKHASWHSKTLQAGQFTALLAACSSVGAMTPPKALIVPWSLSSLKSALSLWFTLRFVESFWAVDSHVVGKQAVCVW